MADDSGELTLGHVLDAAGVTDPTNILIVRHSYTDDGLRDAGDVTPAKVLDYTRTQGAQKGDKLGATPAGTWLVFMADGARRSRFYYAFENRGEVADERTARLRFFDLHPSGLMHKLSNRLVVEWSRDTINWAKTGVSASAFPFVEIADPEVVEFPGFDRLQDWRLLG